MLKFGLFSINALRCCDPVVAARVARAAEAAGFESLWAASTSCCPIPGAALADGTARAHPRSRDRADVLRAVTTRVRLGTGIIIPAAAQSARAGQGARQPRSPVETAA